MTVPSQVMLTNKEELNFTGERWKGDGFYGYADGLHTISFHFSAFVGRIYIDATLEENPAESDWFPIDLTINTKYIEASSATTDTRGVTIEGNFVYLRARVDRSHLTDTTYVKSTHGSLDKVILLI